MEGQLEFGISIYGLYMKENGNLYRGPSIDASYQVSVHFAQWFHRRRFLEIGQSETRIVCGDHACQRIGMKVSKARTFVVLQLVTNVALFEYT
jgi:hypothetical protein